MRRLVAVVALSIAVILSFSAVLCLSKDVAWAADRSPAPGDVIQGRVTSIDYQQGALTVATSRGEVAVATMPTTSVQSQDPGYHTITDVQKGSTVQIYAAHVAGKLVAQIIRLVKR